MDARADFRWGGVSANSEESSIATSCALVALLDRTATRQRGNNIKEQEGVSDLGRSQVIYLSIAGLSVHEAELECAIVTEGLH